MRTRRLMGLAGLLVVVSIAAFVALPAYWQQPQPVLQDPSKLMLAVQKFSQDQKAHARVVPAAVSLRELVSSGYFVPEDVRAFDGMEVTISLTADETRPQDILIRVRLPDGTVLAGMADGSASQLRK